ncbi:ACP phosphodiesterase [Thalassotalea euphylliae]|uniref:acyl carrier protein phosphodiesterase n=1 Tax=Thalassotalea euphylliae TaxID=1655234 RepID=UPI00362FA5AB
MNYLAHLFLSPNQSQVRVGNLMGDFVKGNKLDYLPPPMEVGVYLHRHIDKFTDQHPSVEPLKSLLSKERRRFSGIIADVTFDHFLAKHFEKFSSDTLEVFAQQCYEELAANKTHMPEKMALMVTRMISGNWLLAYREPVAIADALNGISRRIRFENKLMGAGEEVMPAYQVYEQAFLDFFPELIDFSLNTYQQLQESRNVI